jgi:hypothetical protein
LEKIKGRGLKGQFSWAGKFFQSKQLLEEAREDKW